MLSAGYATEAQNAIEAPGRLPGYTNQGATLLSTTLKLRIISGLVE